MLDIHPAHHAATTWRDFFIHIATIVVGLCIAIGLEQTVEYFHHQHQRRELRAGVLVDAKLYLHDVDRLRVANEEAVEDLSVRIQQVRKAASQRQKLEAPVYRPPLTVSTVRLGNASAAKASGLISLLSEDEINSLGDAEVGVVKSEALQERARESMQKRVAFEQRFQASYPDGPLDFSTATPAQMDEYLGLLIDERVCRVDALKYLDLMHGGAAAYIEGQRNLEKLRQAQEDAAAHSSH